MWMSCLSSRSALRNGIDRTRFHKQLTLRPGTSSREFIRRPGTASPGDPCLSTINHQPLYRFLGVTPRSSDVRSLLASLCQELRRRHPLENPIPGDVRELNKELNEHFKTATAQAPLILFLDP